MLHPHLHVWLLSADPSISLEARVYLPLTLLTPSLAPAAGSPASPADEIRSSLSTLYGSDPVLLSQLPLSVLDALKGCGVRRVITACHPWGKLGGNMLDPVIAHHLVNAIYNPNSPDRPLEADASSSDLNSTEAVSSALVTYNVRGVGRSQGSLGLFGLNTRPGELDFGAVEEWATGFFEGVRDVRRVGYSWGSVAALNAPIPTIPIPSILLVSPPTSLFRLTTLLSSSTFNSALKTHLTAGREVWIVHGTNDQFTSSTSYASLPSAAQRRVVGDGDHFYRSEQHGRALERYMVEWLRS